MHILITGASGFVGGSLVEYLAQVPTLSITATGRSQTSRFAAYSNVRYVALDLTAEVGILACDVCIHCAGLADDRSSAEMLWRNNVQATQNLLTALSEQCKLLIFISSASVYDFADGLPKCENDAQLLNTLSEYGRTKLQAEHLVEKARIPSIYMLRPRAVYGRGDRVLMPRILGLIRGGYITVPGKLRTQTSLTHIQNLCSAVLLAMQQSADGVHCYNIADAEVYPLKKVIAAMAQQAQGKTVRFVHIPIGLVRLLIWIADIFGRKIALTAQSLNYITQDSMLSIAKAQRELAYAPEKEFFGSVNELI